MNTDFRHLAAARTRPLRGGSFGLAALFLVALLAGLVLAETSHAVSPVPAALQAAPTVPDAAVQATTIVTLSADADAMLDLYHPGENYGADTRFKVGYNYGATELDSHSLLHFDVASVVPPNATLDWARLDLYVEGAVGDTWASIRASQVISAWDEMAVTWNTVPLTDDVSVDADVGAAGAYASWDVTPLVAAWRAGDNNGLLLYHAGADGASFRRVFYSRENVDYTPRLVVSYHLPPAGSCGGWLDVRPNDGYVRSDHPTTDYSHCESEIVLERGKGGDPEARAYLQVDPVQWAAAVPDGSTIYTALLEVALTQPPAPPTYTFEVWDVSGRWEEGALTWNSQPSLTVGFGSRLYHNPSDASLLDVDVTQLARLWATGASTPGPLALLPTTDDMALAFQSSDTCLAKQPALAPTPPRLFVQCAPPAQPLPTMDSDAGDAGIMTGLGRLRAASALTPTLRIERGAVRYAQFQVDTPTGAGQDGRRRAQWFTRVYSDLLSLDDPDAELQVQARTADDQHIFFRQRHDGIPVYPAQIVISLDGGAVTGIMGNYLADIQVSPTPRLSAAQAEELAQALYVQAGHGSVVKSTAQPNTPGAPESYEHTMRVGETQLRYVNLGLLGGFNPQPEPPGTGTHLAWEVHMPNQDAYFIDANSGELVFVAAGGRPELDTRIFDTYGGPEPDCYWGDLPDDYVQVCDEDGCDAGAYTEAINALHHLRDIYGWWNGFTQGDSLNDSSFLDQDFDVLVDLNWDNANSFGQCDQLDFADEWAVKDVVGHEFTHAQSAYQPNEGMVYANEPGAIEESMADVFGEFAEAYDVETHSYDPIDWQNGEDMPGGPLRNLANPPDKGQPDEYDERYTGTSDHGGVHTNDGILNKAAYLMVTGDSFNGYDMGLDDGMGWRAVAHLFYWTRPFLPENADFQTLVDALIGTASFFQQSGLYGFTDDHLCTVRNAYAAVGIGIGDHDCDGKPDNKDKDDDNDGVPDNKDNCDYVSNPLQANHDSDSMGDACDKDNDNDDREDGDDNCKNVWNPNQNDFNNDGEGDACDDTDGDGVMDDVDNCRKLDNANQLNADDDSFGDRCDVDDDNDLIDDDGDNSGSPVDNPCKNGNANCDDNCRTVPNTFQENYDDDAFGDACDQCKFVYSNDFFENVDLDHDGLGNVCDLDDDGDGVLDNGDSSPIYTPCLSGQTVGCDDNCRKVPNPKQEDWDQDGVGMACDPEGDGLLVPYQDVTASAVHFPWEGHLGYNIANQPGVMLQQQDTYLPLGYTMSFKVAIASPASAGTGTPPDGEFMALIVDSEGAIRTRITTELVGGQHVARLDFQPVPYATQSTAEPWAVGTLAPDEMGYSLWLMALPGTPVDQPYDINVWMSTYVGRVYLPIVERHYP